MRVSALIFFLLMVGVIVFIGTMAIHQAQAGCPRPRNCHQEGPVQVCDCA